MRMLLTLLLCLAGIQAQEIEFEAHPSLLHNDAVYALSFNAADPAEVVFEFAVDVEPRTDGRRVQVELLHVGVGGDSRLERRLGDALANRLAPFAFEIDDQGTITAIDLAAHLRKLADLLGRVQDRASGPLQRVIGRVVRKLATELLIVVLERGYSWLAQNDGANALKLETMDIYPLDQPVGVGFAQTLPGAAGAVYTLSSVDGETATFHWSGEAGQATGPLAAGLAPEGTLVVERSGQIQSLEATVAIGQRVLAMRLERVETDR